MCLLEDPVYPSDAMHTIDNQNKPKRHNRPDPPENDPEPKTTSLTRQSDVTRRSRPDTPEHKTTWLASIGRYTGTQNDVTRQSGPDTPEQKTT